MSSAYETETTIRFDEESGSAEVYTASPRVARMLTARGLKPSKVDRNKRQVTGWFFELPKHSVIKSQKPRRSGLVAGKHRPVLTASS